MTESEARTKTCMPLLIGQYASSGDISWNKTADKCMGSDGMMWRVFQW